MDEFDAIVIGTGFGGAVTACRLAQAGYRICVLERGRRYEADDFPVFPRDVLQTGETYNPPLDLGRWSWDADHGIWQARDLGDVVALLGAGYGGGSLIYANVHLRAAPEAFAVWPEPYRRDELDPYYEIVAHTLRVATVPSDLDKTRRLHEAAVALGREDDFARVPLAVNFTIDGENDFGRVQHACDNRGTCTIGCGRRAKNTLDLNYLAQMEDAGEAPDVRTLAEVIRIARRHPGPDDTTDAAPPPDVGYRVRYLDHLRGGVESAVHARYVFLCAGAIASSELLMRASDARDIEVSGRQLLGTCYHPNEDGYAAVFDCKDQHHNDRGPTITAGVRYARGDDWFLVEDGGFPPAAQAALGVLRSPLWLKRNRYREPVVDAPNFVAERIELSSYFPRATAAMAALPRDALPAGGVMRNLIEVAVPVGMHLPAIGSIFAFLQHEDNRELWQLLLSGKLLELPVLYPIPGLPVIGDGEISPTGAPAATAPRVGSRVEFPKHLCDAIREDIANLQAGLEEAAEPVVTELLDVVAKKAIETAKAQYPALYELLLELAGGDPDRVFMLVRGALRLGVQILLGSEAELARESVRMLFGKIPRRLDIEWFANVAGWAVAWAIDYRRPDGHTALLLTMGRDQRPGRLRLVEVTEAGAPPEGEGGPESGRVLRAELPSPLETPSRATQERIMRDIAVAWRGELRTNPTWSFLRRQLSGHNQGGAPMGTNSGNGVTDPDGEVFGAPGLFVMDAAAFPGPVGVNPSATVAAVAERKIDRFIATHGDEQRQRRWRRLHRRIRWQARCWVSGRNYLDPFAGTPASKPANAQPVGVAMEEDMTGFFSNASRTPMQGMPGPLDERRFLAAEAAGVAGGARIDTQFLLAAHDLSRLLERNRGGRSTRLQVSGAMSLRAPGQCLLGTTGASVDLRVITRESSVQLFVTEGYRLRSIRYRLRLHITAPEEARLETDAAFEFVGWKVVHDDPGFDVWTDTSTVYFELVRLADCRVVHEGILRIPAASFLTHQIKNIIATGSDDRQRRGWAIAAFVRLFYGHLRGVYGADLDAVADLVRQILGHDHG